MDNNINVVVSAADQAAITAALATLSQKLTPYLKALTDAERRGGLKMGDKSVAFVQKAQTYGTQFTNQLPSYISLANLTVDVNAVVLLNGYLAQLEPLVRAVEDTMMLSGGEAMEAANAVYAALQMAAANNVPGAQDAVNDMKQRTLAK